MKKSRRLRPASAFPSLGLVLLLGAGCGAGGEEAAQIAEEAKPSEYEATVASFTCDDLMEPMVRTPPLREPANATSFSFVAFGDNRPKGQTPTQNKTFHDVVASIQRLSARPDFILSLGDVIKGKSSETDCSKAGPIPDEYSNSEKTGFLDVVGELGLPVFNAPGNHEMDNDQDTPSQCMREWYAELASPSLCGAFSHGNSLFVLLNTSEPGSDMKDHYSNVGSDQRSWLWKTLDAAEDNPAIEHVFLAMHYPLHSGGGDDLDHGRQEILDGLGKYKKISYVLGSHNHTFYDHTNPGTTYPTTVPGCPAKGPPYFLVSGGAGAPMSHPTDPHHYLEFRVDGSDIDVDFHAVDASGSPTPPRCF